MNYNFMSLLGCFTWSFYLVVKFTWSLSLLGRFTWSFYLVVLLGRFTWHKLQSPKAHEHSPARMCSGSTDQHQS